MALIDLDGTEQPIDPKLILAIEAAFRRVSLTRVAFVPVPRSWKAANPKGPSKGPKTQAKQNLRMHIARRDGASCAYCAREFVDLDDATLDHVIPNCVVGHWQPWNLLLTCAACNQLKADQVPLLLLPLLFHLLNSLATVAEYRRQQPQTRTPTVPTNGYPSKKAARRAQKAAYRAAWTRKQVDQALEAMNAEPIRPALEAAPVRPALPAGGA